jgi:hypothetical protein
MQIPATSDAVQALATGLREGLARRFAHVPQPRGKDVLDTVEDVICALTLNRLGLPIDAISFNVLMSWSRWLYVADESRYVHDLPGRIVWAAADVELAEPITVAWRGLTANGDRLAEFLPEVYRDLAVQSGASGDEAPLLPIYTVRATAAFRAGVPIPVVDRLLAALADGERAAPYRLRFAVGTGAWTAVSEPPFALGDRPYYFLSLHPTSAE